MRHRLLVQLVILVLAQPATFYAQSLASAQISTSVKPIPFAPPPIPTPPPITNPPPTATLMQTVSQTSLTAHFTVSWSSTNATSCIITRVGALGGSQINWATGTSGSQDDHVD